MLTAFAAAPDNDDFSRREALPSQDVIDLPIQLTGAPTYEPLDPVSQPLSKGSAAEGFGSLWYEWTAPRDGWFTAAAVRNDGVAWRTRVFEGGSLDRLFQRQNGNYEGVSWKGSTLFEAKQGRKYQLGVDVWSYSETSVEREGRLRMDPAPPPPANITLASRAVLSGPLPVSVQSTNMAGATTEAGLVSGMTPANGVFNSNDFGIGDGPVLWWEWTCPATGSYQLKTSHSYYYVYAARRRVLLRGGASDAGDWNPEGVPVQNGYLQAAAGEVFDFAVSFPDTNPNSGNFAAFTLTLTKRPEVIPASHVTQETARALPAAVPFLFEEDWANDAIPRDENGFAQLWYRFTAPVKGYYRLKYHDTSPTPVVVQGNALWSSYDTLVYLQAGENLWFDFFLYSSWNLHVKLSISPEVSPPVADTWDKAQNLGAAAEFTLRGQLGDSTLEPDEPAMPQDFREDNSTGSLWWKWTPTTLGWLVRVDGAAHDGVEIFGSSRDSNFGSFGYGPMMIEPGPAYRIRMLLRDTIDYRVREARFRFYPAATNLWWDTARDLGTVALPAWAEPGTLPVWVSPYDAWYKWTAAETVRAGMPMNERLSDCTIYTDPENEEILPRDPPTGTWSFTAGQTYWLSYRDGFLNAPFEFVRAPLTSHGEPATAMVLPPELPACGGILTRGDTNSATELSLLDKAGHGWAADDTAVVWWKWQAPRDGLILASVSTNHYGNTVAVDVFAGADAADAEVLTANPLPVVYDTFYFHVVQGQTYWIAAIFNGYFRQNSATARLSLAEVLQSRPANDDFAGRTVMAPNSWQIWATNFGVHHSTIGLHPVYYEIQQATLEPGEPPVSLILGEEGNVVAQQASTWWQWTSPVDGLYQIDVFPTSGPGAGASATCFLISRWISTRAPRSPRCVRW